VLGDDRSNARLGRDSYQANDGYGRPGVDDRPGFDTRSGATDYLGPNSYQDPGAARQRGPEDDASRSGDRYPERYVANERASPGYAPHPDPSRDGPRDRSGWSGTGGYQRADDAPRGADRGPADGHRARDDFGRFDGPAWGVDPPDPPALPERQGLPGGRRELIDWRFADSSSLVERQRPGDAGPVGPDRDGAAGWPSAATADLSLAAGTAAQPGSAAPRGQPEAPARDWATDRQGDDVPGVPGDGADPDQPDDDAVTSPMPVILRGAAGLPGATSLPRPAPVEAPRGFFEPARPSDDSAARPVSVTGSVEPPPASFPARDRPLPEAAAAKMEQIKDLYLTAEAIGDDALDKHFDQVSDRQRELIREFFDRSGPANAGS
jgi:hypothetical protein